MSFCPECGEQIAKDDTFCPFCGITLKPLAPVDDASMSETIVGFPSPILYADADLTKSAAEKPSENVANSPAKPADASSSTPGNTSENWVMKTDSVEIPAESLEELKSIPLPGVLGEPEKSAPIENTAEKPLENPKVELPSEFEKSAESAQINDVSVPSIIHYDENDESEWNTAEPANIVKSEEPEVLPSAVIAAESDFEAPQIPAPVIEEPAFFSKETLEEKSSEASRNLENLDGKESEPAEISTDSADTNFDENVFDEIVPPIFEKSPTDFAAFSLPAEAEPIAENLDEPARLTEAPKIESPIAMPEKPLVLEDRNEPPTYDSVKIIKTDETPSEIIEAASPESPESFEKPIDLPAERPYTTPNIGKNDTGGRKSPKLKPLDEGTILNNRYEVVRKIGGGGMGAVYLANDRNLGGVLRAVKEMVQSYIESDQQDKAINDFKRESLLLTSLEHPAIPTIYDYFLDDKEGRFYLVMKYISGGDLAGRLRAAPEGRIDEKSVTEWAIQIADVLDYLHNHEPSIVYRDLKPANVMIDGNSGRVMLIDFGIARWVNKEEKGVTAVGTMGYAPPELFSGNVEARSDIYSLGSTMFHLLTGADPQSNPLLIFDFQKNPRPRQINSQLSDQIEQILIRSVEYNAEARFSSAAELRDSLKEHLTNLQMNKVTFGVKVAPSNRAFAEQAVFCGFCGKQIVATDVFCAFCGAQQPIAQQGNSSQSHAVQPMTAKLVLQVTGELEPSTYRLEKNENLLGRRDPMSNIFPEVDLSKYDPQTKISRRHARIWREGNSFLVEDLGSSNGTSLLSSASDSIRLLPHQPRTLTNGDKIKVGDTILHFTIG